MADNYFEQTDPDHQIAEELSYLETAVDETPHPELDTPAPGSTEEENLLFPWRNPTIDTEQPAPGTPPAPGAPPVNQSVGAGVRQSYGGFGPDQGQSAIWEKGYEDFAENDRRLRENAMLSADEFGSAYAAQNAALENRGRIESEYHNSLREMHDDRTQFLRESMELDKVMHQQAKTEAQQYLDAYQNQLAAVRQMSVTAPLSTLTGGEFAGVALAAFAQGFLGAQGININPIAQINRWEEMSIAQQERQIKQAESGANDQFNLWQIAKETAKDDLEARQRYRGMALEMMGAQIDAQAARFGSQSALAAAQTAKAQIELEKANLMNSLRSNYEKGRLDNLKGMRDEAHKRVEERRLNWATAIEAKYKQALADAAKNKGQEGESPVLIQDSRNVKRDKDGSITGVKGKPISGGKYVAMIDPKAPAGIQSKAYETVTTAQQLHDNLQTGLDRMRNMLGEVEARLGPEWFKKKTDPAFQRMDAERNRLIGDVQRFMTGLAAPESEQKRWLSQLSSDGFFQLGADRMPTLIDDLGTWGRGRFKNALKIPGVKILPESSDLYSEDVNIDPEGEALTQAREAGFQPNQAEQRTSAATNRTEYTDAKPSKFYQANKPGVGADAATAADPTAGMRGALRSAIHGGGVEKWAVELEDLARLAADPDKFISGKTVSDIAKSLHLPEEVAKKLVTKDNERLYGNAQQAQATAKQILNLVGNGQPLAEGQAAPPEVRVRYAKKLHDLLESDPQQLLKELSE